MYLRFRKPITVLDSAGKPVSLNALVVPMEGETASQKVLLLSDPKGIGNYTCYKGYDAAALQSLIEAIRK